MEAIAAIVGHSDTTSIATAMLLPAVLAAWPFARRPTQPPELIAEIGIPSEESVDYLDWGLRLAGLGRIERACEKFRQAVEHDPNDPIASYDLALALDYEGRSAEAVPHYLRAVEMVPDSVDARINLGAAYLGLGDAHAAIAELQAAVSLSPDDYMAHFDLACALLAARDFRAAVTSFRAAIRLNPGDAHTRYNLAIALRRAGCPDLAANELQDFLALADKDDHDHISRAQQFLAEYHDSERESV